MTGVDSFSNYVLAGPSCCSFDNHSDVMGVAVTKRKNRDNIESLLLLIMIPNANMIGGHLRFWFSDFTSFEIIPPPQSSKGGGGYSVKFELIDDDGKNHTLIMSTKTSTYITKTKTLLKEMKDAYEKRDKLQFDRK